MMKHNLSQKSEQDWAESTLNDNINASQNPISTSENAGFIQSYPQQQNISGSYQDKPSQQQINTNSLKLLV